MKQKKLWCYAAHLCTYHHQKAMMLKHKLPTTNLLWSDLHGRQNPPGIRL